MKRNFNLTGKRFGRLIVIKSVHIKGIVKKWLCICDCGKEALVRGHDLVSGNTSSCGCLHREQLIQNNKINKTTHGLTHTRLYRIWGGMRRRCYETSNKDYCRYGKRGITVSKEWMHDFQSFYDWAMLNGYEDNLTIDRINNEGNYKASNCKWATVKEQNNNRSTNHLITYNGKTLNIKQWADEIGINRVSLSHRINKPGWSIERALTEPKYGMRSLL